MAFNPVCFFYMAIIPFTIFYPNQSSFLLHYPFEYSKIIALIFTSTNCTFIQFKRSDNHFLNIRSKHLRI